MPEKSLELTPVERTCKSIAMLKGILDERATENAKHLEELARLTQLLGVEKHSFRDIRERLEQVIIATEWQIQEQPFCPETALILQLFSLKEPSQVSR